MEVFDTERQNVHIEPHLCYLSKLIKLRFDSVLADEGLFAGQHEIIFMIDRNDGITLSELAKKMKTSAASASVSVKRMEKAGFIERKADENDSRIVHLHLTEKSDKVKTRIQKTLNKKECELVADMSDEEVKMFKDFVVRAIDNLEKSMKIRGKDDV